MRYSKGVMWLDDCRIPFVGNDTTHAGKRTCNIFETEYQSGGNGSPDYETNPQGRFTPNLLVCDDMLNDGNLDGGSAYCPPTFYDKKYQIDALIMPNRTKSGYGDKGSNSRYYDLDMWFDKMLERL
jgi:hypothetical protein